MGAPRIATIQAKVDMAVQQIDKDRCEAAKKTLVSLRDKIKGSAGKKRKASGYAVFVKANYAKVQKANPSADFKKMSKLMADAWSKSNK